MARLRHANARLARNLRCRTKFVMMMLLFPMLVWLLLTAWDTTGAAIGAVQAHYAREAKMDDAMGAFVEVTQALNDTPDAEDHHRRRMFVLRRTVPALDP